MAHILICDDNQDILPALRALLSARGYINIHWQLSNGLNEEQQQDYLLVHIDDQGRGAGVF